MENKALVKQLFDALTAAQEQLEYCGYGDRIRAVENQLQERIDAALTAAAVELLASR